MKLCGQLPVIATLSVRFILIKLSATINQPVELDDTGVEASLTRFTKSESGWARLSDVCHYGSTCQSQQKLRNDRALAVQTKLRYAEPGSEPVEHFVWNWSCRGILCGAGVISETAIFSRNWSQSRSQFCLFRIHAQDATRVGLTTICWGPESEPPGYLAQPRSPSRSRYFPALLCRNMGRNYLKFLF